MNQTLSPSSAGAPSPAPKESQYTRVRKRRARQACVTCHARKVKCNVSTIGVPCTNCREDDVPCTIRQRARRHSRKDKTDETESQPAPEPSGARATPFRAQPDVLQQRYVQTESSSLTSDGLNGIPENDVMSDESLNAYPASANPVAYAPGMNHQSFDNAFNAGTDPTAISWSQSPGQYNMFDDAFMTELLGQSLNSAYQVPMADGNMHIVTGASPTSDQGMTWNQRNASTQGLANQPTLSMLDPARHAVTLSGTSQRASAWDLVNPPKSLGVRSSDEIEFLQKQGCLSIPQKPLLREFLQAYFRYAHPAIPMFLESEFDMVWTDTSSENGIIDYGSIFVLQAILFVSCSFVPDEVISNCGFQTVRNARGSFYRRAKLIFDFEGEQDPFNIARGALLLAYQAPNDNVNRINCYWLNQAIRSARIADADLYYSKNDISPDRKQRLKRLWWSCIFRDRILPLGLRRPVQITEDSFDWDRGEPLSEDDFTPEIETSRIYDQNTQRSLAKVLVAMCALATNLTYAITAAFPIDRNVKQIYDGEGYFNHSCDNIHEAKRRLHAWYEETIVEFPVPIGLGDAPAAVVLFANLMYIYYQAGMASLSNREALLLVYRASKEGPSQQKELHDIHAEVVPALGDMTERMREVVHLKMAQYLPVSAVAYLTLPWVIHILDSKFASTKAAQAVKQRRLHIFEDMINHQKRNFDGIEYVTGMVRRLSEYINQEVTKIQNTLSKPVQSWDELLVSHPRFYLRICVFIDLAFSKGEFPFRIDQEI